MLRRRKGIRRVPAAVEIARWVSMPGVQGIKRVVRSHARCPRDNGPAETMVGRDAPRCG